MSRIVRPAYGSFYRHVKMSEDSLLYLSLNLKTILRYFKQRSNKNTKIKKKKMKI